VLERKVCLQSSVLIGLVQDNSALILPETRKFINECRENALGATDDRILAIKEANQAEAIN
jgi:hypothetical protein